MSTSHWFTRPIAVDILVSLVAVSAIAGTTGKISGRVTDAMTGEPLPVANVVIVSNWEDGREIRMQNKLGAASDPNGEYFILNVPPGEYSIEAHLVGYANELVKHVDREY